MPDPATHPHLHHIYHVHKTHKDTGRRPSFFPSVPLPRAQ